MPYLSCKKIENDVYNFPTWQYCKYKDIFDSRIIINSTAKFYISISYQKDSLSKDTRFFTASLMKILLFQNMLGVSYNEKRSNVHCIILCYISSQHSSQINTYDTCQNTKYDI